MIHSTKEMSRVMAIQVSTSREAGRNVMVVEFFTIQTSMLSLVLIEIKLSLFMLESLNLSF